MGLYRGTKLCTNVIATDNKTSGCYKDTCHVGGDLYIKGGCNISRGQWNEDSKKLKNFKYQKIKQKSLLSTGGEYFRSGAYKN